MNINEQLSYSKTLTELCRLIYIRKYKEAEHFLLNFIEKTLSESNNSSNIQHKKHIYNTIYFSFNQFYYNWLKKNNIDIEKERVFLQSLEHTNFLISHSTEIAEMDDLLYDLVNYLNAVVLKKDVLYQLQCYKRHFIQG
ncbi:MAG: hypothetical protein Q7R95_07920 [bacterium]|nr:hypothetical protein [bacterium]